MNNNRKVCCGCKKVFIPEIEAQPKCYDCLLNEGTNQHKYDYQRNKYHRMFSRDLCNKTKIKKCVHCGKFFICKEKSTYMVCSKDCRTIPIEGKKKIITDKEEKIKNANQQWINGQGKLKSVETLRSLRFCSLKNKKKT